MTNRAHISQALAHIQHQVTAAAAVIALCLVIQMFVFGFVHFTEVRYDTAPDQKTTATVVAPNAKASAVIPVTPSQPDRVPGRWDNVLRNFGDTATWVGVLACVVLTIQLLLGVAVAAGAAVPGIDRVITASTWGMGLALACLPMADVLPSLPFSGAFVAYDGLVSRSQAVHSGLDSGVAPLANHVFLPFAATLACAWIVVKFRAGVSAGVIANSVSDFDEKIEHEIASAAARGVGSNIGQRTVGTLHRALGEGAMDATTQAAAEAVRDLRKSGPPSRRPI